MPTFIPMTATAAPPVSLRPAPSATTGFVLLVGLIALVAGGKAVLFDTMDPDCFWHLMVAAQLRAEGIGPVVDRLSFASIGSAWTPYSWLAELGMKATWDAGGYRAAVGAQVLMQVAFVVAVALACRAARPAAAPRCRFLPAPGGPGPCGSVAEPARLAAVLAAGFAAFLSLPYLSFRPVTAALVLLALCAWLLVRDRAAGERTRGVWAVLPLTALMVNLHLYAVFVPLWVGALLAGAVWERWRVALPPERPEADRRVGRYFLLLVGSAAACAATPMLPGVIATSFHYQSADPMVASGYLSEMRPFFYDGPLGRAAGVLVLLALAVVVVNGRKRLRAGDCLWLAASVLFLSRMGRFAPVFALAAAPMLAVTLPALSDRVLARRPVWAAVLVVLTIGGWRVARAFPRGEQPMAAWLNRHGPDAPGYPCDAAEYVARHVQPRTGRLIGEFAWGGYLEWRLGDRYQLLLDGRTQLFTPEFWRATYLATPDERRQFLAGVRADAAVLPVGTSVFRHSLVRLGWRPVYRDPEGRAEVLVPPAERAGTEGAGEGQWSFVSSLLPG